MEFADASNPDATMNGPDSEALAVVGEYATTTTTELRLATEHGRQRAFQWLMVLLALEIVGLFTLVAAQSITVSEGLQMWGAFGPPVTGLLGLATSHYFHHDRTPAGL